MGRRWLRSSGIQQKDGDPRRRGGFACWYELGSRGYPFLYSEITGYGATTWLFLERVAPAAGQERAARIAGEWLLRRAVLPSGGVRTRYYLIPSYETPNYSFDRGRLYTFDSAMVGYGLLQIHRYSGDKRYAEACRRILRFLLGCMKKKTGRFWPYYDPRRRRFGETVGKWSDQGGPFHAKIALFLLEYSRWTGDESAKIAARRLLDATLRCQRPDGRFVTDRADRSTHLHPHCYALEGLLFGGYFLSEERYLRGAEAGMRWARQAVGEDGSVSSLYRSHRFVHHERSDIIAQILRLGSILYRLSPRCLGPDPAGLLRRLHDHLLLFQYRQEGRQKGGFLYGADTNGLIRPHLNTWCAMFALQALWMYDRFVLQKAPLELECFI